MPWALVLVGIFMGIGLIMLRVKSPMLVSVGMYLPFETTFAIFIGGVIRAIADMVVRRRGFNEAQRARVENAGVLTASGLIAGEAILGLAWAGLQFAPKVKDALTIMANPSYSAGLAVMVGLGLIIVLMPMRSAGSPDEPAPPTAMM